MDKQDPDQRTSKIPAHRNFQGNFIPSQEVVDKVWTCMLAEKRSGNLCIASSGIEEIPASPLRKFLESSEAFWEELYLMSW